jgi:hypothetical protein
MLHIPDLNPTTQHSSRQPRRSLFLGYRGHIRNSDEARVYLDLITG